ncbi:hypothetical protein ASE63_06705 [Bosea sp. Root381]|uniref:hypothetical protein n=1 Tax=Bosea sp. Root381 TaxID=1736524 RepID=UPI0006F4A903|nr:hypothetical protein [Bosea sp. Root381]KRE05985.1 hypothetical protein ASE63_06705 [Bosea sp. Root381]
MKFDVEKVLDAGFASVKGYIDRGFAAVEHRLARVERLHEEATAQRIAVLEAEVKSQTAIKPRVRVPAGSSS